MGNLESDIQYLGGVGPKRAALLKAELGIGTIGELLHIYPFRYIDRSKFFRIADIEGDAAYIQIKAKVLSRTLYGQQGPLPENISASAWRSVKRLSVIVGDESAQMETVFFKGIRWNYQRLTPGAVFVFFGKPSVFNGRINMVHPEIDPPQPEGSLLAGGLTGVYPSSEKLRNGGITGKVMCKLQSGAIALCINEIQEILPERLLRDNALCGAAYAIKNIHFPADGYALEKASRRLKFEELFLLQLSLLKQKYIISRSANGLIMSKVGASFNALYKSLPFKLTGAQKRVMREIFEDCRSGRQMNRLLQGDVGSGKTIIALMAAVLAADNGYQTCLMAPTEVLARQHFGNISKYLAGTGVECAILTGSSTAKERRSIHQGLQDGSIGLIVGTHALLEDKVLFRNLGLAIIDEQHRFGVDQRSKLWNKRSDGSLPHILVMTATPIPRTLAMTLYGDLDVSVIDELPPGRKPIKTIAVPDSRKSAVYKFMREQIALGRQVFVVYPLIFESEKMDLNNLENGYEEIVKNFPLPDYKVAIVHGQQTSEVKNFGMDAFVAGRADILVSTTVIEVGVDVPNASVMVIESAQRFGLSQLHQLRGRVGRGADESYCVLVYDFKTGKDARERLELMCRTSDGFEIAEEDLKMRGPGDLEGTQQSGLPVSLSIASLAKDGIILSQARACAEKLLAEDPKLEKSENSSLARELKKDRYEIKDYSKIS